MTTYNTGNPIGSTDARDLYDNAQNLDNFVNGTSASYTDRLGVSRRSLVGIDSAADNVLNSIGYSVPVAYTSGISLTLTNQTVDYNGVIYAPLSSALPFITSSWGTDSSKFRAIQVTDADLITYNPAGTGAVATTVQSKLLEVVTPHDTGGDEYVYLKVQRGNWTQGGGRVYFFNPDAVDVQSTLKNSVTVLGGRGDTGYRVTVGPNAELAFHGGGGDTLLDHLAGTICGGAHHIMTKNTNATPTGSHGFIGGGSYQEVYGDYAGIGWGTLNKNYATKATIVGGDSNTIGDITNETVGRNAFIGGGFQNGGSSTGQYAVIAGGRLNTANGNYSQVPGGYDCKATSDYSMASGYKAVANDFGEAARSSGQFAVVGDTGHSTTHLFRTTTTGTATQLLPDGISAALATVGSNTTVALEARIIGMRTDTTGGIADYTLRATLTNETGTLVIKAQSLTVNHEDNASYNADVVVSGSAYQIRVQAVAGHTVRWSAKLDRVWVRNI